MLTASSSVVGNVLAPWHFSDVSDLAKVCGVKKLTTLVFICLPAKFAAPAVEANMQGDLNCVDMHVEDNGTYNWQIILTNGCGDVVFWVMCVNHAGEVDNEYYEGTL